MVTLSLTPSRVVAVLRDAAQLVDADGWDPVKRPLILAIDRAAGYQPGSDDHTAEELTTLAWDVLAAHLGAEPSPWEQDSARTGADVAAALRASAEGVAS